MANEAAVKAVSGNSQVEGSVVVSTNGEDVKKVSGTTVPATQGMADFNATWGKRSMGNDGVIA